MFNCSSCNYPVAVVLESCAKATLDCQLLLFHTTLPPEVFSILSQPSSFLLHKAMVAEMPAKAWFDEVVDIHSHLDA